MIKKIKIHLTAHITDCCLKKATAKCEVFLVNVSKKQASSFERLVELAVNNKLEHI